jgi:hypothetical protein
MVWALSEIRPYLKRGYTTYIRSVIGSVIMKARNEFPGYQMDLNDPGIPAHVRHAIPLNGDKMRQRIQQLEELNAVLAAQVDRQAKVVDAAQVLSRSLRRHDPASWSGTEKALERMVTEYEAAMAQLAKDDA